MNKRMTEAYTTLRSYLTMTTYTLSAEQHKAACSALEEIEAELDKDVPPVVHRLARAESDYAAYRRADKGVTGQMRAGTRRPLSLGSPKVIARPFDEAPLPKQWAGLQQFKDALRHIDPVELTTYRTKAVKRPGSCLCGTEWTCKIACTCSGPDPDHAEGCHYHLWRDAPPHVDVVVVEDK